MEILAHISEDGVLGKVTFCLNSSGKKTIPCAMALIAPFTVDILLIPHTLKLTDVDYNRDCTVIRETDGPMYSAQARIVDIISNNQLRVRILKAGVIAKKRNFFRVDTFFGIRCTVLSHPGRAPIVVKQCPGNLSGGGILFSSPEEIVPGSSVSICLDLREEEVVFQGIVLRSPESGQGYAVAVEITDISEDQLEKIVEFCGKEEHEERIAAKEIVNEFPFLSTR